MKVLVTGFGKCGARMVLDLNYLLNKEGKNSYELRVQAPPKPAWFDMSDKMAGVYNFLSFFSVGETTQAYRLMIARCPFCILETQIPTMKLRRST